VSVNAPDDLYGLPLDRFVPSRLALVKALRAEKRREEARDVSALRKPSVAAWAVNQLVRTQPKALQALFAAGDDLARAQAQAASGKGGGDAMRGATRRQRDVMRGLLEAAESLLTSDGQTASQTTIDRVGETLRAAANDEDARRQVAGGCVTRELRFVGLGIGGPASSSVTGETAEGADEPVADPEAEAARVAAREHAAALKEGRRTEAEARRAATRADKELTAAQARQQEAAVSLQEAETLLSVAGERAEDAAAKLAAAEQALHDLAQP
jgi:hypothetical protein